MDKDKITFNEFVDHSFIKLMSSVPEAAAEMGITHRTQLFDNENYITNYSSEGIQRRNESMLKTQKDLYQYSYEDLTVEDQLTFEVFDHFLNYSEFDGLIGIKGHSFTQHNYPVNQENGIPNRLISYMLKHHSIHDEFSANNFISILSFFPTVFDNVIEELRIQETNDVIMPKFLYNSIISEMNEFIRIDIQWNPIYFTFKNGLKKLKLINNKTRKLLLDQACFEMENSVYPAFIRLIKFLKKQYSKANNDAGIWKLPNGDAFYRFLLKKYTTTNMTPREIHELGLQEIVRIHKEIHISLSKLGYHENSILDQFKAVQENEDYNYSSSEDSRKQIIDNVQKLIQNVNNKLFTVFNVLPDVNVEVHLTPKCLENNKTSNYSPPSKENNRTGIFELNVGMELRKPPCQLSTLVYHETLPGHHLQLTIAQESNDLSFFRKTMIIGAFIEGWAKYAERIPWEQHWNRDPYWGLSRQQMELYSTVNLALDTGIHHYRWTREKGIKFFQENAFASEDFSNYVVNRICATPGQTCSYKIGMMKILQLRNKMEKAQGHDFNIKHFHDIILKNGSLPLSILENIMSNELSINTVFG